MRCILTKRPNGLTCLTKGPPVIMPVGLTDHQEVYVKPGDPIGLNNICPWFIEYALPEAADCELLESHTAWLAVLSLEKPEESVRRFVGQLPESLKSELRNVLCESH